MSRAARSQANSSHCRRNRPGNTVEPHEPMLEKVVALFPHCSFSFKSCEFLMGQRQQLAMAKANEATKTDA
jgi:hypothetical protein